MALDNFPERRAFSRIAFDQPVLLRVNGRTKPLVTHGVDVSHSGLCVNVPLDARLIRGSRVCVNLARPTGNPPVIAHKFVWYNANVVRVDRVSRLLARIAVIGLQFTCESGDSTGTTGAGWIGPAQG